MYLVRVISLSCLLIGGSAFIRHSLGAETQGSDSSKPGSAHSSGGEASGGSASSTSSAGSVKKRKGGSHSREKEADGTQAYDRFKADTAIKSRYHLNGHPLEVDPD